MERGVEVVKRHDTDEQVEIPTRARTVSLEIEIFRFCHENKTLTICLLCGAEAETGLHFLVQCTVTEETREDLIKLIDKEYPQLNHRELDSTQFFHFVLNVNTLEQVNKGTIKTRKETVPK